VHFNSAPTSHNCDVKVLILLYTPDRKAFIGFIPNDQAAFVDRLRKLIQHQKASSAMLRQGQVRFFLKKYTFIIMKCLLLLAQNQGYLLLKYN
jgi:hypothetical protein